MNTNRVFTDVQAASGRTHLVVPVPNSLVSRLDLAASRDFSTRAGFVRRAVAQAVDQALSTEGARA